METLTRFLVTLFLHDGDCQKCCIKRLYEHGLITIIKATQAINHALLSELGLGFAKQDPHERLEGDTDRNEKWHSLSMMSTFYTRACNQVCNQSTPRGCAHAQAFVAYKHGQQIAAGVCNYNVNSGSDWLGFEFERAMAEQVSAVFDHLELRAMS